MKNASGVIKVEGISPMCICKKIKQLTCRGGHLVPKVVFLLFEHLFQLEVSQAAGQWLQRANVNGSAIFAPIAGQQGNQVEEEQLVPNHRLNYPTL